MFFFYAFIYTIQSLSAVFLSVCTEFMHEYIPSMFMKEKQNISIHTLLKLAKKRRKTQWTLCIDLTS